MLVEQRMFSGESLYDKDVARYVMRAMKAVDEEYTKRSKAAGEVVKQHLKELLTNVSYEYQGSVMTDTHIRGASDIDLLVLCDKFVGTDIFKVREELAKTWKYNSYQLGRLCQFDNSFSQYEGNSFRDMAFLRTQIEKIMSRTYTICDISKPKAVKITNQNLHRDVDIVTSSWFQSLDYVLDGMPENKRGIKIYNKSTGFSEGPDYPFLSISRINQRSSDTNGRLKRMIRFLKNVRTDSEKDIPLTSFEINAICYSIPVQDYAQKEYKELVYILWYSMFHLWNDGKQDELKSVVGDEYIFKDKPEKLAALKVLEDEVDFGFMVFSADDELIVRDKHFESARDNVLFEYGLFLGRVGLDRAFVIAQQEAKIPTDLLGITNTRYEVKSGTDGKKVATDSLEKGLAKLKKQIDESINLGHLGLLPSTVLAISYFEGFVKLAAEWLTENTPGLEIDGTQYDKGILKIVMPDSLDADIKKCAMLYYKKLGLKEAKIDTKQRSYPIHFATKDGEDSLEIYDMPTILTGIDKAIDMYFRVGHIGKKIEQELAEENEMNNFRRVLQLLINEDAFCRECVVII